MRLQIGKRSYRFVTYVCLSFRHESANSKNEKNFDHLLANVIEAIIGKLSL